METLNRVSRQVIYADVTVGNLTRFFDESGLYDKSTLARAIETDLILTEFANRQVSNITHFYTDAGGRKQVARGSGHRPNTGNDLLWPARHSGVDQ